MEPLCYLLSAVDNGSFALGGETRKAQSAEEKVFFDWRFTHNGTQHPATCSGCGRKTNQKWVAKDFKIKRKRNYDFTCTYDGYYIASSELIEALRECGGNSFEAIELPNDQGRFAIYANETLKIDRARSQGIRFLYPCKKCGEFAGVFGVSHLKFESPGTIAKIGISRTDLEFAQAHEQSPKLVVGIETANFLKQYKFRGLSFIEVTK